MNIYKPDGDNVWYLVSFYCNQQSGGKNEEKNNRQIYDYFGSSCINWISTCNYKLKKNYLCRL